MDLLVFVDGLEDVRGRGTVREFQVVEALLSHLRPIAFLKVFYVNFTKDVTDLVVGVFEKQMGLHVLLLQQSHICFVLSGLHTFTPPFFDIGLFQCFRDPSSAELSKQRVGVEDFCFEEVELRGKAFSVSEIRRIVIVELVGTLPKV